MIKRSYKVLRFLNQRHIWPLRLLAALVGGGLALVVTGKPVLAREMFAQFYAGSFKLGGRRTGFYLRAGWPGFHLADDPFFNFAEGLPRRELEVLHDWLAGRSGATDRVVHAGDMMIAYAGLAHAALERDDQSSFERHVQSFKSRADTLLAGTQGRATPVAPSAPAEVPDTPGFAENAGQVLRDFEADLPFETWQWFVIGGTFLGLVRDKAFLPHDVDLDAGIFAEDLDVAAFEAVFAKSETFSIAKFDYQSEIYRDAEGHARLRRQPAMLKLVHANGINIDVFLHERREGKIWHGSGVNKWVNDPFGLAPYEIEGQRVLGPDNADHYLREHYGEWRIVVKDFSCITGTTNLAFVKNLSTIAVLLKRYAKFTTERPLEAAKVMRELTHQGYVIERDGRLLMANHIV